MSGLISMARPWGADKDVALTGYTPHVQLPGPIAPGFIAPERIRNLTFGPIALAAAVARAATTREDAPCAVLDALRRSTLPMLETMVEDGATFGLSKNFQHLADSERTFFAARVGGGITDLYMNALGYTWRANASCLSSAHAPHPDFIYEGGRASGHGVVVAEAHGSFAANASTGSVHRQSKNKYLRQVKRHLAAMSPHGKVIHGYSIAFGSAPTAPGAFLSLSETKTTTPTARRGLPSPLPTSETRLDRATPTSIALAAHRSNFFLMGADHVVDWIDWVRTADGERPEPTPVEFRRLQYAGRQYLLHPPSPWRRDPPHEWLEDLLDHQPYWHHAFLALPGWPRSHRLNLGWFAMEEAAGRKFLNSLTGIIQDASDSLPATLQLPTFPSIGFGLGGESIGLRDGPDYPYALFRDGLALLGEPRRGRPRGVTTWSPGEGLIPQ